MWKKAVSINIIFLCSFMHAQEFALQKLENSPRHQEWIQVKHGDRIISAFLVFPETDKKSRDSHGYS